MEKERTYTKAEVQEMVKVGTLSLNEKVESQSRMIEEQSCRLKTLTTEVGEYKSKDSSISMAIISAIEKAQQIESSSKKLYELEIQRARLLYLKMQEILKQLYTKYPELRSDESVNALRKKFEFLSSGMRATVLGGTRATANMYKMQPQEDPLKKLLMRITTMYDKSNADVMHVDRKDSVMAKKEFDLREALTCKKPLEDIMKAFNLDDVNG